MFDRVEKDMDTLSLSSLASQGQPIDLCSAHESKGRPAAASFSEMKEISDEGGSRKFVSEKSSKKKRGKSAKSGPTEDDTDNYESLPTKVKKNQRKSKDTNSLDASDMKSGSKKGLDKTKEDSLNIISEEWIAQRILALAPDLGDLGEPEDPHALIRHLSNHLRPMLLDSWKKKRNTVLLENSERRRRLLDNLQKQLDEAVLDIQLYEKALDLFEDDPATSVILHKHLLKTMATPVVDKLISTLVIDNKLKNGVEVGENESPETASLSSADRISLSKSLPGSLSVKAQAVLDALEGKVVDTFMIALRAMTEESGLLLKKLDKKLERTLLHSYRKDLTAQVSSETDAVALLPKIVALLYLQFYNKALQAPGRAISAAASRLKNKLPDSTYKVLMDYHAATVTLLALQSAATGDEEDCTSDRILSKKEFLESKMPELKGLVLTSRSS
ncbi:E3 UFM1-protein ligase 1-like protein [Iris pallida]|uniref:E3 UFM1-protein ligase 1-like protein n=1 Tax=Iris pallida TaxID=29817 RepID=A0AAX6ELK8_IRIPA|nr:E3 UFM1-protein ligase 1-like protein [Iris pallida]